MKYIISSLILLCSFIGFANEAKLIVTGYGNTPLDAQHQALRSALEQSFGAYITSETEIINDILTKDEMKAITSGQIVSFEILNETKIDDDNFSTTLEVTVTLKSLVQYVNSKGHSVELSGGVFAMNILQEQLNEQAELKVITNTLEVIKNILKTSFDWHISANDPQLVGKVGGDNENYHVDLDIRVMANDNLTKAIDLLKETIKDITMSEEEIDKYHQQARPFYRIYLENLNKKVIDFSSTNQYFDKLVSTHEVLFKELWQKRMTKDNFTKKDYKARRDSPNKMFMLNSGSLITIDWYKYSSEFSGSTAYPWTGFKHIFLAESTKNSFQIKELLIGEDIISNAGIIFFTFDPTNEIEKIKNTFIDFKFTEDQYESSEYQHYHNFYLRNKDSYNKIYKFFNEDILEYLMNFQINDGIATRTVDDWKVKWTKKTKKNVSRGKITVYFDGRNRDIDGSRMMPTQSDFNMYLMSFPYSKMGLNAKIRVDKGFSIPELIVNKFVTNWLGGSKKICPFEEKRVNNRRAVYENGVVEKSMFLDLNTFYTDEMMCSFTLKDIKDLKTLSKVKGYTIQTRE